jgi:hypothetical protein
MSKAFSRQRSAVSLGVEQSCLRGGTPGAQTIIFACLFISKLIAYRFSILPAVFKADS